MRKEIKITNTIKAITLLDRFVNLNPSAPSGVRVQARTVLGILVFSSVFFLLSLPMSFFLSGIAPSFLVLAGMMLACIFGIGLGMLGGAIYSALSHYICLITLLLSSGVLMACQNGQSQFIMPLLASAPLSMCLMKFRFAALWIVGSIILYFSVSAAGLSLNSIPANDFRMFTPIIDIYSLFVTLIAIFIYSNSKDKLISTLIDENNSKSGSEKTVVNIETNENFTQAVRLELSNAMRDGCHAALCYFDIKNLSYLEQRYGELKAKRLSDQFGKLIFSAVRGSDKVMRVSSRKYAVMLGNIEHLNGVDAAILNIIRKLDGAYTDGTLEPRCKYRTGASIYPEHSQNVEAIIQHSEEALTKCTSPDQGYVIWRESLQN